MNYWSMLLPGQAERLIEVRKFAMKIVGEEVAGADLVELVASELAGNAILHTASGEPGGVFVVHLAAFTDRWQVRVDDAGGPNIPRVSTTFAVEGEATDVLDEFELGEAGRGLALVAEISEEWGVLGDEHGRAVWAEIAHPHPTIPSAGLTERAPGR